MTTFWPFGGMRMVLALFPSPSQNFALSARLGEMEGSRRGSDGEGEVSRAAARFPHLTPTLSAPGGGEGELAAVL
jgi:hypothetical protein